MMLKKQPDFAVVASLGSGGALGGGVESDG